jgi:hypothetical protein
MIAPGGRDERIRTANVPAKPANPPAVRGMPHAMSPHMRTPLLAATLSLAVGCAGRGEVMYSTDVRAPDLVEISPGVEVVADYDQPVFYSDQHYWRQDAGVWYRSERYDHDWVRVDEVPAQVRTIERPEQYVHYRGHEAHKQAKEARKDAKEARKDAKEERKEDRTERHEAEHD